MPHSYTHTQGHTMIHTLDLFDTTVDATSMTPKDVFTSVLIFLAVVVLVCILLSAVVSFLQDRNSTKEQIKQSIVPHVIIALAGLALFAIPVWFMADAQTYSAEPTKRLFLKPPTQSHVEPTDPTKSLVALTHDNFVQNINKHKDLLNDLGLDKKCNLIKSTADDPDRISVLCGGYSLDEVETHNAVLRPQLRTSADRALYDAWSIDPHNVDVHAEIFIREKTES